MNLLIDDFISTTDGKISLKTLLTSDHDYQLQYYFDETQLAMLQLLSSLTTVVLKPSLVELKNYFSSGLTSQQYDEALSKIDRHWFEDDCFMRSKMPAGSKAADGPITKLISGVECGGSVNALGLFSEVSNAETICPDCTHVLNYNLHMNIKGECFGPTGATGIRGGGAISTLISGRNLKSTVIANTVAVDFFAQKVEMEAPETCYMWDKPIVGDLYPAHKIGLTRGLFALAYHIDFPVIDEPCVCDVCGHKSLSSVKTFNRVKYKGSYGSTKKGRDGKAGWWLHPYTPTVNREDGIFPVCARDHSWQSWQDFSAYIIGKETDKSSFQPAYIIQQFQKLSPTETVSLLVGGNIADQGSVVGRVYDLYSMPGSLSKNVARVIFVVDAGLKEKDNLSNALNKMFGAGYDKNFVAGIKEQAVNRYIANAQQIIQQILLDVNRKEAAELRRTAITMLNREAKRIYAEILRKYQHDLPLFKALVKGEVELRKMTTTTKT